MSSPVQAQSLSTLTNLFANPPQYPRNPTHKIHDPLVLYIVRVPGSKDVFLTPIKPPTKASIGLEAIQSSLYYFHVATAEDEEIKRSADAQRQSEEEDHAKTPVARKPLASTLLRPHPLPPLPHDDLEPRQYTESANIDNGDRSAQATKLELDTNGIYTAHRKPLNELSPLRTTTLYHSHGDFANSSSALENQSAEYYRSRENDGLPSMNSSFSQASPKKFSTWNQDTTNDFGYVPSSLTTARRIKLRCPPVTIIRRDPTSGSQWNIGTITQLEPTLNSSRTVHPVAVELQTPGYGRFNRHPEIGRPGSAGSDVASIRRFMEANTTTPLSAISDHNSSSFERVVDYRTMNMLDIKKNVYQSSEQEFDGQSSKSAIEKNVLSFTSPWQGVCTFVNGIDGRTLKIKHTIPSTSSTTDGSTANVAELRFNLSWALLGNRHARKDTNTEPDTLPIPKLIESKKENMRRSFQHFKEKSRDGFRRVQLRAHSKSDTSVFDDETLRDISNIRTPTSNNLDRPYPLIQTPSYSSSTQTDYEESEPYPQYRRRDLENEDRLSLRLGRERAGGGFGGHSAKLGKLIIEDEGLKMCDLVVGAAMGVWWQHYEGK